MQASEFIKKLQNYIDDYGDLEVVMRVDELAFDYTGFDSLSAYLEDKDFDTLSIHLDELRERLVISNDY